jgi:hypothetical protein
MDVVEEANEAVLQVLISFCDECRRWWVLLFEVLRGCLVCELRCLRSFFTALGDGLAVGSDDDGVDNDDDDDDDDGGDRDDDEVVVVVDSDSEGVELDAEDAPSGRGGRETRRVNDTSLLQYSPSNSISDTRSSACSSSLCTVWCGAMEWW